MSSIASPHPEDDVYTLIAEGNHAQDPKRPKYTTDPFATYVEEHQTPLTDISSSDSDHPSNPKPAASRARLKKIRKSAHQTQPTVPALRPAKDILSRIRHDPDLDESQYVVGYLDRHEPELMEMDVSEWKGGDVTDEEWIPQHRIVYFRRKGDPEGRRVWDRVTRLDRLFGSGVTEGMEVRNGKREMEGVVRQAPQDGHTSAVSGD